MDVLIKMVGVSKLIFINKMILLSYELLYTYLFLRKVVILQMSGGTVPLSSWDDGNVNPTSFFNRTMWGSVQISMLYSSDKLCK